jgi:environmental stress-induced protein Ves
MIPADITTATTIVADTVAATPWKNGGGLARDLLFWPTVEGWRVRVSLADITRDGPFSPYPGVDRWFAVVEGPGVELQLARGAHQQRLGDAPVHFDGAEAPGCRLLDGPTRDLNLMLQGGARGVLRHGTRFDEDWPVRARYDPATHTLHWGLPAGPLQGPPDSLWLGVAP